MRRYRHALIRLAAAGTATAAALVALPGTAGATSPKQVPACNLLLDPLNDDATPVDSPHLDIRSGDVASGQANVAGALRVRDLPPATTAATPGGARWDLSFVVGGARYTFVVRVDAFGVVAPSFTRDAGGGPQPAGMPAVSLNPADDTITWTVPRAALKELPATPNGDTFAGLAAKTYLGPADSVVDAALSSATYTDGGPSCLKVA
jgi:hypothetical protein